MQYFRITDKEIAQIGNCVVQLVVTDRNVFSLIPSQLMFLSLGL